MKISYCFILIFLPVQEQLIISLTKFLFILLSHQIRKISINILTTSIRFFNNSTRGNYNHIYFWYCPSKAEQPRHKIVNTQVKEADDFSILPSKNSFLFSRKKECNDILKEQQDTFPNNCRRGQLFLNFEDNKGKVLKPTYTNGGSQLLFVESSNSLCARFTCMTTRHASIGEYRQRILCSAVYVGRLTSKIMNILLCSLYNQDTRSRDISIGSFVHFLIQNPTAFSFDNG